MHCAGTMHHCRFANACLNVERVAAVSVRALTDELAERADFAVAGTRPKRASTA